jgi:hypothetical protein
MKKAGPWIVVLVIVGGLAAWYFYGRQIPEEHPSVVSLPIQKPALVEPPAELPTASFPIPADEPEAEPLPPLAESDQAATEALADLIGPESLGSHFVLEQVIPRIVATVDALDSRQLPPLILPVKPPANSFQTAGTENLTIHPANADRYGSYVSIAATLDTQRTVEIYVRYYPLFQQAYADLGYGDAHFNDRVAQVIDHLLLTPEPATPPALVKPEAVYLFEDPDLEALSAGQKLLLRIGPDHAAVVMDKLRELREALAGQNGNW